MSFIKIKQHHIDYIMENYRTMTVGDMADEMRIPPHLVYFYLYKSSIPIKYAVKRSASSESIIGHMISHGINDVKVVPPYMIGFGDIPKIRQLINDGLERHEIAIEMKTTERVIEEAIVYINIVDGIIPMPAVTNLDEFPSNPYENYAERLGWQKRK